MNPFFIEGIQISLDTWRWLYYRQYQDIKVPLNKAGLAHLNTLVRHGLLVYRGGRFCLTEVSSEVLLKADLYEQELKVGVPISYKSTVVSSLRNTDGYWIKGKTREKKPFYTNNEIILFTHRAEFTLPIIDGMSLDMEVLVSQIQRAIFAEGYIDVYPRVLQRPSFFEPGVIWFKGNVGNSVTIKEPYYDLIGHLCKKIPEATRYAKILLDKDYIVAINPFMPFRYFEDIIAIVSACSSEELNDCII